MTKAQLEEIIVDKDKQIEALSEKLATVRDSHADWVSGDERKRKEFAKAFGWYEQGNSYSLGYKETPRLPSWEEIFVKLGKLLANKKDYTDMQTETKTLRYATDEIKQRIANLERINEVQA